MFNFKNIMKLAALVSAASMFFACSDGPLASKNNMIPDNALVAVKVDAHQIWEKAVGEPGSQVYELWNMAKSGLSVQLPQLGEFGELVRAGLNDPKAYGINMDEPVVISCTGDIQDVMAGEATGDVYVVTLLEDSEAFVKLIDAGLAFANTEGVFSIKKEVVDDTYTYYNFLSDDGTYIDMGVSKCSAVIRCKYDENKPKSLKESMLTLFVNGGPAKTDGLKEFYASKGDAALWMDVDKVMDKMVPILAEVEPAAVAQIQAYLPMYEGASFVSDLNFMDGKTELNFKVFGSKELEDYTQKYNAVATGRFFEQMPYTSAVVVNVALKNFKDLVDELCKMNSDYAEAFDELEEYYDVDEKLLAGFPGEISFALDGKGINTRSVPGFAFFMECKRNVWEYVELNLEPEYYEDVAHVSYEKDHIAAIDAVTYAAADLKGKKSFADSEYAKLIKKGGVLVDLSAFPASVLNSMAEEIDYSMTGQDLLQYLNSVVITVSDDHMSSTLTVNMGDKEHNLLEKAILGFVQSAY